MSEDKIKYLKTISSLNDLIEYQQAKLDKISEVCESKVFGIYNDRWVIDVNEIDKILEDK